MTKTDLNRFQRVLENERTELGGSLRRLDAIAVQRSADPLDRLLEAQDRELATLSLDARSAKLKDVCAALERIRDGSFGECEECGGLISPARLSAIPSASLCIQCQATADGTGRALVVTISGRPADRRKALPLAA